MDRFTRHIGVITLALAALTFAGALVWQVIQGHDVDPILAGLVGTTLGAFLPNPVGGQRVTVDNAPSDPVPVDAGHGGIETVVWVLVVVLIVVILLSFIR